MSRSPEDPVPQAPNVTVKVRAEKPSRVRTVAIVVGSVAAGVAATLIVTHWGGGEQTGAQAKRAEVFRVEPAELNCRAIMQATVEADAWNEPETPVDHTPLGVITRPIERSYRATATFTGPKGKGGGETDTIVCFNPTKVSVTTLPNGQQVEHIPDSALEVASFVDSGGSETLIDHGDLSSLRQTSNTIVEDLPGSRQIKTSEQQGDARIASIANQVAVDETVGSCFPQAWGIIEKAITDAEQEIAAAEYKNQETAAAAKGETVKPFEGLRVDFDSAVPHPRLPYEKLGPDVQVLQDARCEVAPGALRLNATAQGVPIVDTSRDPVQTTWDGLSKEALRLVS